MSFPRRSILKSSIVDNGRIGSFLDKTVRFDQMATVRLTLHANDISEKIRHRYWYSEQEIEVLRANNVRSMQFFVGRIINQIEDDQDIILKAMFSLPSNVCARGLENLIPAEAHKALKRRREAMDIVFDAQKKQKSTLAEEYSNAVLKEKIKAYELGLLDEMQAQEAYLSCDDSPRNSRGRNESKVLVKRNTINIECIYLDKGILPGQNCIKSSHGPVA